MPFSAEHRRITISQPSSVHSSARASSPLEAFKPGVSMRVTHSRSGWMVSRQHSAALYAVYRLESFSRAE